MTKVTAYIHGTDPAEQGRLAALNRLTNPRFLEFLEITPNDLVLEVGSGLGILAGEIAERASRGKVVGIEYSLAQLAAASTGRSNLHFQQADAHALPLESNSFDAVYCRYLLEHVNDPLRVLQEMRRVLKPGGKAFVQENNILVSVLYPDCPQFDSIWRKFATLQEQLGGDALIGKKLFTLFKQAGFQDISLSIAPETHRAGQENFYAWIDNLAGNVTGAAQKLIELGLATRSEIKEAVDALRDFRGRDDSSAIFYWNRAIGWK